MARRTIFIIEELTWPPAPDQPRAKLDDCVGDLARLTRDGDPSEWTWENVPGVLRRFL